MRLWLILDLIWICLKWDLYRCSCWWRKIISDSNAEIISSHARSKIALAEPIIELIEYISSVASDMGDFQRMCLAYNAALNQEIEVIKHRHYTMWNWWWLPQVLSSYFQQNGKFNGNKAINLSKNMVREFEILDKTFKPLIEFLKKIVYNLKQIYKERLNNSLMILSFCIFSIYLCLLWIRTPW